MSEATGDSIRDDVKALREVTCEKVGEPGCALPAVQDLATRMDERQRTMGEKIEGLEHAVYGNGKEGLKTLMDRVSRDMRLIRWLATIAVGGGLVFLVERILSHVTE
jgi:hypothetical protein